ncbi:MAG: hypothetical protein J0M02_01640 [Planctomycetes bacterium]|nr:hypothetical protein [Planctomycetota bacterium]
MDFLKVAIAQWREQIVAALIEQTGVQAARRDQLAAPATATTAEIRS